MRALSTVTTVLSQRSCRSVTTLPTAWSPILGIAAVTTATAGAGAMATGFIDPIHDFEPPTTIWKPLSAFVMPGLFEELIWRAALIPSPTPQVNPTTLYTTAAMVLAVHVVSHPVFSAVAYPRGRQVFGDARFLFLATIVLGGTTVSYLVSGGSVWVAVLTHSIPVILWRDFFGGERRLQQSAASCVADAKSKTKSSE